MKISRLITATAVAALAAIAPATANAGECTTSTIGTYKLTTCTTGQDAGNSYGTGSYGTGSYGTGSYGTGATTDSYGTG